MNVLKGLKTFNASIGDHGNIYPNRGHGFVDPLTGILLWLGVAVAVYRLSRAPTRRSGDLLALIGFGVLYLSSAFLITKAPNYTRLLVTLPFVAYLAAIAVETLATLAAAAFERLSKRSGRFLLTSAAIALAGAVAIWNLAIFQDFATTGRDAATMSAVPAATRRRATISTATPSTWSLTRSILTTAGARSSSGATGWASSSPAIRRSRSSPRPDRSRQSPGALHHIHVQHRVAGQRRRHTARFPGLAVTAMTADGRLLAIEAH